VVGLAILAQVLMFGYFQQQDIARLDAVIADLKRDNQMLAGEKTDLVQRLGELRTTIQKIPSSLLIGFEDPEAGFVEFLDFLNEPEIQAVGAQVSISGQEFQSSPIPMHVSKLSFKYDFRDTVEAEEFVHNLLYQDRFPLKVDSYAASRGEDAAQGDLAISLMIPAKLELDQSVIEQVKEAEAK
jgi:hypothetical protein